MAKVKERKMTAEKQKIVDAIKVMNLLLDSDYDNSIETKYFKTHLMFYQYHLKNFSSQSKTFVHRPEK